jgi:hypothetical protein
VLVMVCLSGTVAATQSRGARTESLLLSHFSLSQGTAGVTCADEHGLTIAGESSGRFRNVWIRQHI